MKILINHKTAEAEMHFNKKELGILNKKKKLVFDPTSARDFANHLGAIATDIIMALEKNNHPDLMKMSEDGGEIKSK
jgi:hypothetical protein|tara:strand:+ start:233 stop:463 length:231 start_codon:yes stop_codon:yes gene_type:complete